MHGTLRFLDVLAAEPRRQCLHRGLDIGQLLDQFPVIDDPLFVGAFLAKKFFHQALVQVAGHAFVQPDIAPGPVADQVPGPGMGKLMGDQRNQAAIAGDHGRRDERKPGIFHAAIRKAGRQDQQIITAPLVVAIHFGCRIQHILGIGKLMSRRRQDFRFGINTGLRPQWRKENIADGDRQQVAGNWLRHFEAVLPAAHRQRIVVGAHQGQQLGRGSNCGTVGYPNRWRVLQRYPAPCMYILRLRKQEGVFAARGKLRWQPLQGCGARVRPVVDRYAECPIRIKAVRQTDGQRFTQFFDTGADQKFGIPCQTIRQGHAHTFDMQRMAVQHQFPCRRIESFHG